MEISQHAVTDVIKSLEDYIYTCIKNIKFKIIKIRTGCQYVGYLHNSENLNWAAPNLRLCRGWT